uniref:Uncharacterized protein n=1 Tax=Globodera rostochiensis TaxID=31243 RepID=A0A914HR28_GLORO
MSNHKKLINFASEILNCGPKEVGAPLQFATNQRRVERAINNTLNRGATLRYELDDKQFEQLNGNKLVVVEDRPF